MAIPRSTTWEVKRRAQLLTIDESDWATAQEKGLDLKPSLLYVLYMKDIAVSDARKRLAEIIDEARSSGAPVGLSRRGNRAAVILSASAYESLVAAAEDVEDRAALAEARAVDDFIPWDEVKADLGLT